MNELSLFSGYGGFSLGLKLARVDVRTIGYVEIDKYCQEVLKARMEDGILDEARIYEDIKTFDGTAWRGHVDILTGGFPCPPFSVAGVRSIANGLEDERNLWPETLRLVREIRPRIVFLENVPGILSGNKKRGIPGYASIVVGQLAQEGYRVRWEVLGADDVGAPHRRKRWWCIGVADSINERLQGGGAEHHYGQERTVHSDRQEWHGIWSDVGRGGGQLDDSQHDGYARPQEPRGIGSRVHTQAGAIQPEQPTGPGVSSARADELADSDSQRGRSRNTKWEDAEDARQPSTTEEYNRGIPAWPPGPNQSDEWRRILTERPDLAPALTKDALAYFRGVDDGASSGIQRRKPNNKTQRLKILGNGIVPQVAAAAWLLMMEPV